MFTPRWRQPCNQIKLWTSSKMISMYYQKAKKAIKKVQKYQMWLKRQKIYFIYHARVKKCPAFNSSHGWELIKLKIRLLLNPLLKTYPLIKESYFPWNPLNLLSYSGITKICTLLIPYLSLFHHLRYWHSNLIPRIPLLLLQVQSMAKSSCGIWKTSKSATMLEVRKKIKVLKRVTLNRFNQP